MAEATRNQDTRAAASRDKGKREWRPPVANDAPDCPEGMRQRWVRIGIHGEADKANYEAAKREGWEPVTYKDIGYSEPDDCPWPLSSSGGYVQHGALRLMRMPTEMVEQRNAYYRQYSRNSEAAIRKRFGKDVEGHGSVDMKRSVNRGGRSFASD